MKSFIIYLLYAYAALTVQAVFFKGVKPDFVLVLVCVYSIRHGHLKGVSYGALCGMIIDAAGGFILGPNIISKSVAAFLARSVRENIFNWNIVINTIVIALLSVADTLLVYISHRVFAGISYVNRPWKISLAGAVLTVAAALLMYRFLNPEKDDVTPEP